MIKFACSSCDQRISVDDKHAGKRGKCPKCGQTLVIPGGSTAIEFPCASCGHRIKVPQRYAGKKGRCPKCRNTVVVPPPQGAPAAAPETATIACAMCGQAVAVPQGSGGDFVECPGCGSYIDPTSGDVTSPADDALETDTEEELYEETPETTRESMGIDRRVILILSAVAAIVVVGIVALIVVLKSSGPKPTERAVSQPDPPRVADARPEPQPAPPTPQPIQPEPTQVADTNLQRQPAPQLVKQPSTPTAASAVLLRFDPTPGTKRTMRVAAEFTTSAAGMQQQDVESFTFDLEATQAQADGLVPIAVVLVEIQVESKIAGKTAFEYDSNQPLDSTDQLAMMCAPFVGKRFTINVSPRAEIADAGLDELFRAVAADRLKAEDDATRERVGAMAEQAIQKVDQRFGSRENRLLAMKKQLEELSLLNRDKIHGVLSELAVALPGQALRQGDSWSQPIAVPQVDWRLKVAATYTLTAVEAGVCTIQARGQRRLEEDAFVQETGPMRLRHELGGSSQATLTVDRQTGWLLSKEQKTNLSGRVETSMTGKPDQDTSAPVSLKIATTVTTGE